jgi:CHAD domain-containing protein
MMRHRQQPLKNTMLYQKPPSTVVSRAEREGQRPLPRLNAMMACDTSFRIVARRYLGELTAHQQAACRGDPIAVHQMRIALTRLRTAIMFFSPMVADARRAQIRDELKWLNAQLGAVRDLDVAIERLKADDEQRPQAISYDRSWNQRREEKHRRLARALRSLRYRRLVKSTSEWIENGPWSVKRGKAATQSRALPIAAYSANKLARWQQKLLKKSRKLLKMGTEKRHRLRLLNKKLTYSIEAFEDLFADRGFSRHKAGLKYVRRAQRSLGQLNDGAKGHSIAATLKGARIPARAEDFLSPKDEKRLLRSAVEAYRKLAALKR